MGTADECVKFFEDSAQREDVFATEIAKTDTKKSKLLRFCHTRWVERYDAFDFFIEVFVTILEALEIIRDKHSRAETVAKANGLIRGMMHFEFIITIIVTARCLSYLKSLSIQLQERSLDTVRAFSFVAKAQAALQDIRNNATEFHKKWHDEAAALAESVRVTQESHAQLQRKSTETTWNRILWRSITLEP